MWLTTYTSTECDLKNAFITETRPHPIFLQVGRARTRELVFTLLATGSGKNPFMQKIEKYKVASLHSNFIILLLNNDILNKTILHPYLRFNYILGKLWYFLPKNNKHSQRTVANICSISKQWCLSWLVQFLTSAEYMKQVTCCFLVRQSEFNHRHL